MVGSGYQEWLINTWVVQVMRYSSN